MSNENIFEVYEIPGERWANMIYFGVKLKDANRDANYDNLGFAVQYDPTEFEYVPGTLTAGSKTLASLSSANDYLEHQLTTNPYTDDKIGPAGSDIGMLTGSFIADNISTTTTLGTPFNYSAGTYDVGGVDTPHDEYIAKFMLKRVDDTSGINWMKHYGNYNEISGTEGSYTFNAVNPAATADKDFDFGPDNVTINVSNHASTYAPNVEAFVSNGTLADGLSIIPVQKVGDLVQFQVLMNVSYPTTFLSSITNITQGSIKIEASEIVTESIYLRNDDASTVGAVTASYTYLDDQDASQAGGALVLEGADVETTDPAAAGNFMQKLELIADSDSPDYTGLATSHEVVIDFTGITADIGSDGKYVLADFWARNSADGFKYTFTDTAETDDPNTTTVDESTEPEAVITMTSGAILSGTWTGTVNDGSDISILGDSFYANPVTDLRSITSNDASEALKMSVAAPADYDEADFIAADFNQDGKVTSADALDILRTSAYIEDGLAAASRPSWFYVRDLDLDTLDNLTTIGTAQAAADLNGDGNIDAADLTPTVAFDPFLDMFIGTDTVINATAVLTGDTDHDYRALTKSADPIYNWYTGLIGSYTASELQSAGSGNVAQGNQNQGNALQVADTGHSVSSTTEDMFGAAGHALMPEVTSAVDVSVADPDTATGVTAVVDANGMMTITGGAIDTADEAADAAKLVAVDQDLTGTDEFVVGWVNSGNTYVFKLDDSGLDGTFVVTGASKYGGAATGGLSTATNTDVTIKVDVAAAANPGSSLTVTNTGFSVTSTTEDMFGAEGHTLMGVDSVGVNVSDADPDNATGVTAFVDANGMMTITGGSIDTADEAAEAAKLVAVDQDSTGTTEEFVVGWINSGNTYVFKLDDSSTDGTFVVTSASMYTGAATGGLSTATNTDVTIKIDTAAFDPNQGGSMDQAIDVTAASTVTATSDPEVFKLPAGGTAEIIQFDSAANADGDVIEGFVKTEDTIKISGTATSLTALTEISANTESEVMAGVGSAFSGASYVSPAGGLLLVNIVDVDSMTEGDQGGQKLMIDSTGDKQPDYMIMLEAGTFATSVEAAADVSFIA